MQTASFGLLACGAVFEFSMDRTSVCVCEDQIAATCHLALAPIRVVSHSEELVFVQNLLPADIVRQQAVTQCMKD